METSLLASIQSQVKQKTPILDPNSNRAEVKREVQWFSMVHEQLGDEAGIFNVKFTIRIKTKHKLKVDSSLQQKRSGLLNIRWK